MANESSKQPVNPRGPRIAGDPSDPQTPAPNADPTRSEDAPTGISERLDAQREGHHIPAQTPDGKPYADEMDPDRLEKGRANIGTPGGSD